MGSHGGMQAQSQEATHLNALELGRQGGSLYSLTLDEVQNQLRDLGKPLTSMNIDELLKNLCSVESNQGIGGMNAQQHLPIGSGSSVQRQSSITLSRDLSKKTVDEVLRDIQHGQKRSNLDRQPSLGEITLEDFLVRAGVVVAESVVMSKKNMGSVLRVDPVVLPPQQAQWTPYQIPSIHQPQQEQHQQQSMVPVFMPGHSHSVQQTIPIGATPIMEGVYPESQMTISPSALVGTLSDTQTPGRKRVAGDGVERSVERRQKRMIKNRESAARSRARKQAYTNELENKISRLEEENERLKRQQEIEKMLPTVPPPEPKYQLRRTSSAPTFGVSIHQRGVV